MVRFTACRGISKFAAVMAACLLGCGLGSCSSSSGQHPGGDPGDRLMARLSVLVQVVPGFGSGRIPWFTPKDPNGNFPDIYATKIEPAWDSCDGRAGTFGWEPVMIQIGFKWTGSAASLADYLNHRLVPHHLTRGGNPWWGQGGDPAWVGPSHAAPDEALVIEPPGAGGGQWMAFIEARPVGRLASGC
jgi:hypothetical protein